MTRTSGTAGAERTWSRPIGAIAGVLLAAGVLVACTQEQPEPGVPANSAPVIVPGRPGEEASTIQPGEATAPFQEERPNAADVEFIQDMIVHHAQAGEMAELVPDRAFAKDVKGIADRIGDTQRLEIDMMNRWLEGNDKPTVDPDSPDHGGHGAHATMPGMATPEQLDALRAARGTRFDTLFLQLMMAHHEGALVMVEEHRTAGVSIRVQEIADDVAVTQADEIQRMRGML